MHIVTIYKYKFMRRSFLALVMFCAPLLVTAQNVIITQFNGKELVESLSKLGRIEILDGGKTYQLWSKDNQTMLMEWDLSVLKYLTFSADQSTEVKLINGNLVVDAPTTIYDLSGRKMAQFDSGQYSTSGLSRGIYIVISGKSVSKIIVK